MGFTRAPGHARTNLLSIFARPRMRSVKISHIYVYTASRARSARDELCAFRRSARFDFINQSNVSISKIRLYLIRKARYIDMVSVTDVTRENIKHFNVFRGRYFLSCFAAFRQSVPPPGHSKNSELSQNSYSCRKAAPQERKRERKLNTSTHLARARKVTRVAVKATCFGGRNTGELHLTPVPRIQDFYPSASSPPLPLVAALLSTPHTASPRIRTRDVVTSLPSPTPLPLFPSSARHFDSCNWPSAKLPTYGELALRFCGAAGRAVYQRCCNTVTFCSVLRARAADSAQFYMQFRGGGRSAEREREGERRGF